MNYGRGTSDSTVVDTAKWLCTFMKIKNCTKCNNEYPATIEYFSLAKCNRNGLSSWCRECDRKRCRKWYQQHSKEIKEYHKEYRQTLNGCLQNIFTNIKQRCNNSDNPRYKDYGGRGIKCLFISLDNFRGYIKNDMGYNAYGRIKGLQIHRINNNGHYEKGNIKFVTDAEHRRLHKSIRRRHQ